MCVLLCFYVHIYREWKFIKCCMVTMMVLITAVHIKSTVLLEYNKGLLISNNNTQQMLWDLLFMQGCLFISPRQAWLTVLLEFILFFPS